MDSAIRTLLDRARNLAAHGQKEIAIQTWQQVLLSDPANREALTGLARTDMQLGRTEEAQGYLGRLQRLGGSTGDVQAIQSMPTVGSRAARLRQAGQMAAAGDASGAFRIYQDIFGDQPPAGDMALAYYDTEAGVPSRRQNAIDGLRTLSKQFPADSAYTITLGRILTYDPRTRAEGVSLLSQYSASPKARAAIEQATRWNAVAATPQINKPANVNTTTAPKPVDYPGAAGYRALNAGNLPEAERQFRSVLAASPDNPQALGGLGYVRMKQNRFPEAVDLLDRARKAGASGKGLNDALSLSRFWTTMGRAAEAQKNGDLAAALSQYKEAQSMRPASPEAAEGVAGVLLQQGNASEAAAMYTQAAGPGLGNAQSWKGLFLAQMAEGDSAAAAATATRTPIRLRNSLENDPGYLAALILAMQATGNRAEVERLQARALSLPFPDGGRGMSIAQQLQYAELLQSAGRYSSSVALYNQVLAQDPENFAVWRALIAAEHQSGHDDQAQAMMDRAPASVLEKGQTNPDFLALLGSIYQGLGQSARAADYLERALAASQGDRSGIALQLASIYAANGQSARAYALYLRELDRRPDSAAAWSGIVQALHNEHRDVDALARIQAMPVQVSISLEQDPAFLQLLGSVQSANGQSGMALESFGRMNRIYHERQVPEPVGAALEYAWLLERTGNDRALYPLVQQLGQTPNMSDADQATFRALVVTWTVRRATAALRSGDRMKAVALLSAAHSTFPADANISNALAGVYLQIGEPKQALALYSSLDMTQATLQQYQGAIGAALAAGDSRNAEVWLETALPRFQNDPTLLRMAAQYEQARGDTAKARAYYRAALQEMGNGPGRPSMAPGDPTGIRNTAPAAQRLMELLAPASSAAPAAFGGISEQSGSGDAPLPDTPHGLGSRTETLGDFSSGLSTSSMRPSSAYAPQPTSAAPLDEVSSDTYSPSDSPAPQSEAAMQGAGDSMSEPAVGTVLSGSAWRDSSADLASAMAPDGATPALPALNGLSRQKRSGAYPAARDQVARDSNADYVPDTFAPVDVPAPQEVPQQRLRVDSRRLRAEQRDESGSAHLQNAVAALRQPSDGAMPVQQNFYDPPQSQDASGTGSLPLDSSTRDGQAPFAPPQTDSQTPQVGLPPLRGPVHDEAVRPLTPREEIQQQLQLLESGSSGWLGGSAGVMARSGQPGLDQLTAFTAQIETSAPIGQNARLSVIANPVLLDAGTPTVAGTYRQGTLPLTTILETQSASGVGGEVQLRAPSFGASIGYTPYGFLVSNVTGSLLIHPAAGHFTLTFSRQPVLDTQLSWAGLRDLGSQSSTYAGNIWGGVVADAGELQIASGDAKQGWYIQGGGQYLTGEHVQSNTRVDGDAGAYWKIWEDPQYASVTVGANFFGMHYANNLRYFTYGQGGYFSPSTYLLGNVPVTVAGHYGLRFHYNVIGSLGLQAFNESSAPYFPLDSTLQAAQGNPYYAERTDVSANYDLHAQAAYAIDEHWIAGAYLSANNSRDYTSSSAGFYVRYLFQPQPLLPVDGPTGLFPINGLRPLRVP